MSRLLLHPPPPISITHFPKTSAKPLGVARIQPTILLNLTRAATVRCMANQRRVQKVSKQIMREISDMLVTDKVLAQAVLPETALGADLYLSSLTTVTDVEVSSDLQMVKVYVSVFGDERGKAVALAGLKAKAKYVRHQLGKRMSLRLTPDIRFIEDESSERGSRVIAILDQIKYEQENPGSEKYEDDDEDFFDEDEDEDGDEDGDEDENEDEDEPNEADIIYVD